MILKLNKLNYTFSKSFGFSAVHPQSARQQVSNIKKDDAKLLMTRRNTIHGFLMF